MAQTETFTLKIDAKLDAALRQVAKLEREIRDLKKQAGDIEIGVDVDADAAKRTIKDLLKDVDKLDSEQAEIQLKLAEEDLAKQLADIIEQVGKLDALDPQVEIKMAEGDALIADIETIESKLKEIGDTKVEAQVSVDTSGVEQGVERVRGSADGAKNALANMTGNAVQDLGALGGVAGSSGVLIGQLAEFAADGSVALGQLAALAGPMVALGVGLEIVNRVMASIAETKAFNEDQAKAWADVIREGGNQTAIVRDHLAEIEDLQSRVEQEGGPGGWFQLDETIGGMGEFITTLNRAGVGVDEFVAAITGGAGASDELRASLEAAGVGADDIDQIMTVVTDNIFNYNEELGKSERRAIFFAQSQQSATEALENFNDAQDIMVNHGSDVVAVYNDMADGAVNTTEGVDALNRLMTDFGLTSPEEVYALVTDEMDKMGTQAEQAKQEAADLARAIADAGDALSDLDADDFEQIASGLQAALDIADAPVDFSVLKASLFDAFDEIDAFITEHGPVNWDAVLGLEGSGVLAGFDAQLAGMITSIRDDFQTGIVAAFQEGGQPAAEAFLADFLPALMQSTGLSLDQARQLLGLPEDGSLDVLLKPIIDAQAKADALAILSAIEGIDPNNPILAFIKIALTQGTIDPEIAEIAALLAAQELGVPVSLDGIPPEDIAAAQAFIDSNPMTVPVTGDPSSIPGDVAAVDPGTVTVPTAIDPVGMQNGITAAMNPAHPVLANISVIAHTTDAIDAIDEAANPDGEPRTAKIDSDVIGLAADITRLDDAADTRTATIVATVPNIVPITNLLDNAAAPGGRNRPANIHAIAHTDVADDALDAVAEDRIADFFAMPHAHEYVESLLNNIARDRTATIYVRTVGTAVVPSSRASEGPDTLAVETTATELVGPEAMAAPAALAAAPSGGGGGGVAVIAAPAPNVTNNYAISVRAGVIGNRFEVERVITRSLRSAARIGGSRN